MLQLQAKEWTASADAWKTLNELVTSNLIVSIPFYSGFLAQNVMTYGKNCLPNFDKFRPVFFVNEQGLPLSGGK